MATRIDDAAGVPPFAAPLANGGDPGPETPAPPPAPPAPVRPWSAPTRVAFRFAFAYLLLYNFPSVLSGVPVVGALVSWYDRTWRVVVPWVGAHVLGLAAPVTVLPNGSGDTTWNYVQQLCFAVLAAAVALAWSAVSEAPAHRPRALEYRRLHQALRTYVRYVLAFVMIAYGAVKVIKAQFPDPTLDRLIEPFGEFSPMGVLWSFMGYSAPYNLFAGLGETVGGLLLFSRRTTTLGALLLIAVLSNVVLLNYAYDVPVKLFSTNLLLMAAFLAAPDAGRLLNVLVLNRAAGPADLGTLPTGRWWVIGRRVLKTVLVLGGTIPTFVQARSESRTSETMRRTTPLYGLYDVERFERNGQALPPLATDTARWHYAVFPFAGTLVLRTMAGDSSRRYPLEVDTVAHRLTVMRRAGGGVPDSATATLSYARLDADHVTLNGVFAGDTLRVALRRIDPQRFRLLSRGYRWVNEYPYNR